MKLVELLAKELSEWPEDAAQASQDYDREIRFYDADEDQLSLLDFFVEDHADDACDEITFSGGGVRVSKAQWQAERDRQKGGEWKRHRGGKQPVADGTNIEYKLRDGSIIDWTAEKLDWRHSNDSSDIMQYRVISQPQAEEVEVKDTTIGTLSYKVEIDTTEASQAIDELAAKWDQIETPFKWRDEVTELNAYIEEFTREREALINRLAEEGFALLPAMTAVMGVEDIDMSDWRNWQAGDIVECVTGGYTGVYTKGNQYKVEWVKEDCFSVYDDCGEKSSCDWFDHDAEGLKFISRP